MEPCLCRARRPVPGEGEGGPEIHVVYVDPDPVVLTHARNLLAKERNAVIIKYDMRETDNILADHELRHQFDFTKPVGLLCVSMLQFLPDADDPGRIIS